MATISELNVKLVLSDNFDKALGKMQRTLERSASKMSRLGNDLALAVSLPLAGIGMSALKSAGEMESLRLAIETTMVDAGYSIEAARSELDLLRKAALAPGLDFEQAVKASIRLQNVGMQAEEARKTIQELANTISLSGGTAEDLDGVTIQMAQMISKGKVLSQDLRIIQERMPKISMLMKDAFGTSNADALQKMGVTGREFVDEMTKRMSGLSRVQGGLANAFVNFGSSIRQTLAVLGEEIDRTFDVRGNLEKFSNWIGGVVQWFKDLDGGTKKAILTFAAFAVVLGPVIKIFAAIQGTVAQGIGLVRTLGGVYNTLAGQVLKAAAAFQAMDLKTKLTTIGMIAAAVAALVLTFQSLTGGMNTAQKVTATMTGLNIEAAKSMASERLQAERLTDILKDENASREQTEKALAELNKIAPEYFKGLNTEKAGIEGINAALKAYISNIEKRAKLAAANERLIEIEKKLLDTQERMDDAKPTFFQQAGNAVMSLGNAYSAASRNAETWTKNLGENKKALEAQKAALLGFLKTEVPVVSADKGGGGGSFAGEGKGEKAAEKTAALEKLQDVVQLLPGDLANLAAAEELALESMGAVTDETKLAGGEVLMLGENLNYVASAAQNRALEFADSMKTISFAIQQSVEAAASSMQQAASAGASSFKTMGKAALKAAADVVRAALMEAVASQIKKIIATIPFPFNLALAAAGGAAVGILFNKVLKSLKVPAFAEGGMVTRPTLAMFGEYPGASHNPEFALRKDQLQGMLKQGGGMGQVVVTGEVRWTGRDFVIGFREAEKQFGRVSGR